MIHGRLGCLRPRSMRLMYVTERPDSSESSAWVRCLRSLLFLIRIPRAILSISTAVPPDFISMMNGYKRDASATVHLTLHYNFYKGYHFRK